jgi:transcriptional regulator with XRE-family HTH domain
MLPNEYDPAFDYESHFYQELSERLRVTGRTLGISEREAADAAGVTIATYRKYEKGGRERSSIVFRNFCDELDVSYNWLLTGEGRFLARDSYERRSALRLVSDAGVYVKARPALRDRARLRPPLFLCPSAVLCGTDAPGPTCAIRIVHHRPTVISNYSNFRFNNPSAPLERESCV